MSCMADYQTLFQESEANTLITLNRDGSEQELVDELAALERKEFPFVAEEYAWSREEQLARAEEFRDRIEYIYHPEGDAENHNLPRWRLDDTARLETTRTLPFGSRVLEAGCSSGTVSIEIAKVPSVRAVVGIDIRPSAILHAEALRAELLASGALSSADARKIIFRVKAIEELAVEELYDTVCAFEVLEHLTPNAFDGAVQQLVRLMKPEGNFLMSVPNRYPDQSYVAENRTRWNAPDHKNFFSKWSLETLLKQHFKEVRFFSVANRPVERGVYLCAEGRNPHTKQNK